MTPNDARHGTNGGYLQHIFAKESACTPCRDAHSAARRQLWRKRYVRGVDRLYIDATGTIRRIRALMALGWRFRDIDAAAGHDSSRATWAHNLTTQQRVHVDTAERIARVYDEMSMTIGPSVRLRKIAMNRGWAPPLAFTNIDDPKDVPLMDEKFTRWDSIDERFWGRVNKTDTCWLWTGRLTEKGYGGRLGYERKLYYPHQFSYILHVGPIPTGLVIDHLCRVRHCVNPTHLEPVTAIENTRRGAEARWLEACPNDHDPSFRSRQPGGKVRCSECEREGGRRYYGRRKEAVSLAARERYARRQATLDEVVVDRLLRGEEIQGRATKAERVEVVRRWQTSGRSLGELEKLLGWNVARELKTMREAECESA